MSEISDGKGFDALFLLQKALEPVNSGDTTLVDALTELFPALVQALGCREGRLQLTDHEGRLVLQQVIANGRVADQSSVALPAGLAEGIEAHVLAQGELRLFDNTADFKVAPHTSDELEIWSVICAPIVAQHAVLGTLTLLEPGPERFSPMDAQVLSLLANRIGTTITLLECQTRASSSEERFQNLLRDRQDLAAILVHDLQGPAGNVVTSLEMIQEQLGQERDSNLAALVDIAVRSSRHLQSLIESLLDISRLETGQMVPDRRALQVGKVIDQVLDLSAPEFEERRVEPVVELEPGLPAMLANESMIQRVLYNLLDNALKQSKQNQTITIRATGDPGNSAVLICVADQGPGIPEEFRARIFEKFQRVERSPSSKGLGLGLAFCKLAVEAHGGRIWVEDCIEGGACFCLSIPTVNAAPLPTSP